METDSQFDLRHRSEKIKLPGFGLPVETMPDWIRGGNNGERFPHAIADIVASEGVTVRERRMLYFINQITDKPEWERKVFDDEIVSSWRKMRNVRPAELNDEILSEKMFDFVGFYNQACPTSILTLTVHCRASRESRNLQEDWNYCCLGRRSNRTQVGYCRLSRSAAISDRPCSYSRGCTRKL
jgi:hypothetical protein